MTSTASHQRVLANAIADVVARLDQHAGQAGRTVGDSTAAPFDGEGDDGAALPTLVAHFGLTPFEQQVLVLCAAAELDATVPARCAVASADPSRAYPTFGLALAALDEPHWSALTPVAPLRRWRLVHLSSDDGLTAARIRIDERVLHFLAGVHYLDDRLRGIAVPIVGAGLPASYDRLAADIAARWRELSSAAHPPHADLFGADATTRAELAAAAARRAHLALYTIACADLPVHPEEREQLARLWEREAILLPAAVLVEVDGVSPEQRRNAEAFLADLACPAVVSATDPAPAAHHRPRFDLPPLTIDEQRALWNAALDGLASTAGDPIGDVVAQFTLPPHVIRAACASVRRASNGHPSDLGRLAWQAGLAEARIALEHLGRRVEPQAGWDNLVLPAEQLATLREIVAQVRQRATVYTEWGFEAVLRSGLGVTALFAGSSGTGKTLAAEVLARELGLDLFVIDLSQVVSKYIGETEKNLRGVFEGAERGGALLLFDEADALFGKRSEVKDSHDRYANLEISYLLQRMESYRGLAILTTNMKKAIDTAFLRRIRFVVEFPFPTAAERVEIWRRVLPDRTPTSGVDVTRLGQLTTSGGHIRNIAVAGACLAADEGSPLRMRHLLAGARTEYRKCDRSLTAAEVAGWS